MRWQKAARLAIAAFVIVFAGVVFFIMRQRMAAPPPQNVDIARADPKSVIENRSGGVFESSVNGKLRYRVEFKELINYASGRNTLAGVRMTIPDRNGKTIVVTSDQAEVTGPTDKIEQAIFTGNVCLTTNDGIEIKTATANYTEKTGVLYVPGAVEFTRGRMTGTGVGATYDKARDVLWLLAQVHIIVAPDNTGHGAAEGSSETAGLARGDNYLKMTRNARVVSEGRTITADDLTGWLKPDGETIERVELRGNSRITETGANARNMSATEIDLAYAPDGRTLQSARLRENAVVDLPDASGGSARRISGRTIDMAMAPDGTTVTSLNAHENVQVDLPAAGDQPAKRIVAASLQAAGPAGQGLRSATFAGGVEYRERRAARGSVAAIDRTARSEQLVLDTKPGLGEIERADFRGQFKFTDASNVTAEAPRGVYYVNGDRMQLSPSDGDRGPTPSLNDGQVLVEARNIQFSPSSKKLTADTNVRSTMQPRRTAAAQRQGRGSSAIEPVPAIDKRSARMPAMLQQDRPVYVASNRLSYDGTAEATYTGNARLWQDQSQSKIDADTIILNDRTGNLTARTNVVTSMMMEDVDPETKKKTLTLTTATSDVLVYDDNKRLAVYTGTPAKRATMKGVYGDVDADRIDMYLKESGNELERAEAHGHVTVREAARTATGETLIYTSANDTYVMTGNPVEAIEREAPNSCKKTTGTTLTFHRSVGTIRAETPGVVPLTVVPVPCPAERRD